MLNVIPIGDKMEHEPNRTCHCNPFLGRVFGTLVAFHRPYDGRTTDIESDPPDWRTVSG